MPCRDVRRFTATALILLVLSAPACERQQGPPETASVLGQEPVGRVELVPESTDVLIRLAERGRRSITLLHLSDDDNIAPIARDGLATLGELARSRRWDDLRSSANRGAQGILRSDNYLFAAAKLGYVREVYWVLPSKLLTFSDAERRVRAHLAANYPAIPRTDAEALRYQDGCMSGPLSGILVHICSVETLPSLPGPVTVDMDAGFVPPYAAERRLNVLAGMKKLYGELAQRRIAVTAAYVRQTQREGALSPLYLHVAGQLRTALEDPKIMRTAPPEAWRDEDVAAALLSAGAYDAAARYLRKALRKHGDVPSLRLLDAVASAVTNPAGGGKDALAALCTGNREYCYALVAAGRALRARHRDDDAAKVFAEAVRQRPDLFSAVRGLADIRMEQRDYAGALPLYRKLLEQEESLSLRLAAADCLFFLERPDEARAEYAAALAVAGRPGGGPPTAADRKSLRRAAGLFAKPEDGKTRDRIDALLRAE